MNSRISNRFEAFRALHAADRLLILANAWDPVSAALFASLGASAIATSSAGLAWSRGYADGDALPPAELFAAVDAIRAVVRDVPLSIDVEGGYAGTPDEVAALVADLYRRGVAGINLEDGTESPDLLVAKIEAVKRRMRDEGGDVFINARTDVILRELVSDGEAVRESIARARRYVQAGADGIFVPNLEDRDAIRSVAAAIGRPLNVLAVAGLPAAKELFELGARRLSAGASIGKLALGTACEAAAAFLRDGDSAAVLSPISVDYTKTNALLRA